MTEAQKIARRRIAESAGCKWLYRPELNDPLEQSWFEKFVEGEPCDSDTIAEVNEQLTVLFLSESEWL